MTIFGVDFHPGFQAGLDMAGLKRAGMTFALCKVTEGSGWYRKGYHAFSDAAKQAGLLFSAYHFLRSESSGEAQAAHCRRSMGDDWGTVPVMLDWETSVDNTWADVSHAAAFITEVRRLGGRIHLNYLPRWYWDRIGKPDLSTGVVGSLALIQSSYVAGTGSAAVLYPGDASVRWTGFGGAKVSILQFSSKCQIPGYGGPLDINAFKGSRAQLAPWFHDPDPEANMPTDLNGIMVTIDADIAKLMGGYTVGQKVPLERVIELTMQRADAGSKDVSAVLKAVSGQAAAELARDQAEADAIARLEAKTAEVHQQLTDLAARPATGPSAADVGAELLRQALEYMASRDPAGSHAAT